MPLIRSLEMRGAGSMLIEVESVPDEADPVYGETRERRADKLVQKAEGLFREGLDLVRDCAKEVEATWDDVTEGRPDEVEVAVAIKLDAEVGAFIAKSTAGAQLEVKMTWRLDR